MSAFPKLAHPIVQAPLAGGPSTPELAAAVSEAGGLGFVAAGYLSASALGESIDGVRAITGAPFGVNLFYLSETPVDEHRLRAYAKELEPDAARHQVQLGAPRFEDDQFDAKLELVIGRRVPIVSFTFGCPPAGVLGRLRRSGISTWVTVTDIEEAIAVAGAGADALVVQGVEAGGHRGSFSDLDGAGELSLLPLLALVARACALPIVGAGGIADGAGVAAVLAAGARAAQLGTAFMRCPEAGTAPPHSDALARRGTTALTRSFTGRRARGIVNQFMRDHDANAPHAYPHVHHITSPLRKAARAAGDADAINLWAGEAYPLAEEAPAGELVRRWSADARAALRDAHERLETAAAAG